MAGEQDSSSLPGVPFLCSDNVLMDDNAVMASRPISQSPERSLRSGLDELLRQQAELVLDRPASPLSSAPPLIVSQMNSERERLVSPVRSALSGEGHRQYDELIYPLKKALIDHENRLSKRFSLFEDRIENEIARLMDVSPHPLPSKRTSMTTTISQAFKRPWGGTGGSPLRNAAGSPESPKPGGDLHFLPTEELKHEAETLRFALPSKDTGHDPYSSELSSCVYFQSASAENSEGSVQGQTSTEKVEKVDNSKSDVLTTTIRGESTPKRDKSPAVSICRASSHTLKEALEFTDHLEDRDCQEPEWFVQRCAYLIANDRRFEICIAFMIFCNAITIGVQEDWVIKHLESDSPWIFKTFELCFVSIFTFELLLRILAEGAFFIKWKNKHLFWNIFDVLVVSSSWLEDALNLAYPDFFTTTKASSSLTTMRVFRIARILRVVRAMRFFRELRDMVEGIFSSLKPLIWCLILLSLVMFTFAVIILQVAGQSLALDDHTDHVSLMYRFGGLLPTIYTLFISISGGLNWGEAADLLKEFSPLLTIMYCTYVAFAVFCVLNIVTGVFVENANSITRLNADNMVMEEMSLQQQRMEDMTAIFFQALQDNKAEELTEKAFVKFAQNGVVQAYFRKLGLNIERENSKALFRMIDGDSNGAIDLQEFVDGCLQFVGNARQLDVVRLRREVQGLKRTLEAVASEVVPPEKLMASSKHLFGRLKGPGRQTVAAAAVTTAAPSEG